MSCPIYLINLPQDQARGDQMTQQLQALGLEAGLHRVAATYGKHLSAKERAEVYSESLNDRQYHLRLSPGEIGCYVSHWRIWKMLLASDAQAALVLEDDVVLHPSLPAALAAVMALPQPTWDMIKLVGRHHEKTDQVWPLEPPWQIVRYSRIPSMTAAYMISREGARKLLESRRPFGRPVDVDLRYWWENDLLLYGLLPYPVTLDNSSQVSSIGIRAPTKGWGRRWRKMQQQVSYSLAAWWQQQRLRQVAPYTPPAAPKARIKP